MAKKSKRKVKSAGTDGKLGWTESGTNTNTLRKKRKADYDEQYDTDADNGPTGHGDICMSDADPGL